MAGKHLGLPPGVEFVGKTIRIRFTWKGATPDRRCETLNLPQTPKGIAAAAALRDQATSLIKHKVMTDDKYLELFPNTSYETSSTRPNFFEYANQWVLGREVVDGTRRNYASSMNLYWLPHLGGVPIDHITSPMLKKVILKIEWPSANTKRAGIQRLSAMFKSAAMDGLIERNPCDAIELPQRNKPTVDPFTQEEAEQIVAWLYANMPGSMGIYAAYFEFAFFTGMRPGEIAALRWEEISEAQRVAHVCRIVVDYKVQERTKTRANRLVKLNSRAMHALEQAKRIRELRAKQRRHHPESPYVFPPTKTFEYIQQASVTDKHFKMALRALGIRQRPQYNCRHTYATICLMAGMTPAFIANQLGHSVQMLLTTYARWLNSAGDWDELNKFEQSINGTELVR